MNLREWWLRITTTRYTRALEAEVARLRAENRALLNSILGIAGVPPLPVVVAPIVDAPPIAVGPIVAEPQGRAWKRSTHAAQTRAAQADAASAAALAAPALQATSKQGASVAVPMRRRSWQQINRMLEFESAKKKESSDPA